MLNSNRLRVSNVMLVNNTNYIVIIMVGFSSKIHNNVNDRAHFSSDMHTRRSLECEIFII